MASGAGEIASWPARCSLRWCGSRAIPRSAWRTPSMALPSNDQAQRIAPTADLNRIVVVGSTGSGKTTLARALSGTLGIPHIELDALHWGPHWTPVADETFRQRVRDAVVAERWVSDG